MKINHGLMQGQVLQRDRKGRGCASISGTCRTNGTVEIRVLKNGKPLLGKNWTAAGTAQNKSFEIILDKLPTGGPYCVELRVRDGRKVADKLSVEDIFVGDVWILAGQSNMQGVGNLEDAPSPHDSVRAFYMRDEWARGEETLHFMAEAVDVFHNGYGDGPDRPTRKALDKARHNSLKGVSSGLAFGLEMRQRTRVPQGLIACAHGGTSMAQWSPDLLDKGGASLYGAMMRRYEKLGQPIAGIIWYQGESDANKDAVKVYTDRMIELVSATRKDMKLPRLPWVIVQLGRHTCPDDGEVWNQIQEQQRLLPKVISNFDVVPAVDLSLDDGIHISGKGQQILGSRLARAANRLVHKNPKAKPGIALKNIALVPTPLSGPEALSIEIAYSNVAGKLQSPGLPVGFSLVNKNGKDIFGIYKITLKANKVLLHTGMSREQLAKLNLFDGHGRFPVCNIIDSEGMSIPVMKLRNSKVLKF